MAGKKRPGVFAINKIAQSNKRRKQREKIIGKKGVVKQRGRAARAKIKAVITGGSTVKAAGIQATKRVGDYRRATMNNKNNRLGNTPSKRKR